MSEVMLLLLLFLFAFHFSKSILVCQQVASRGPRGAGGGWRGEMGSGKSKSVLRQNRARLAAALKVLSRLATLISIGGLSFGNVGVPSVAVIQYLHHNVFWELSSLATQLS